MITVRRRFSMNDVLIGVILILFGTMLLLHKTDIIYLDELGIQSIWHLWPFIIVLFGIGKLFDAPSVYHCGNGLWLIFIGLWLYVSIYHVYGLSFSETWPAILIVWGAGMMWDSFTKQKKYSYQMKKEENYGQ